MATATSFERLAALATFVRQFSMLINSGVSVRRGLDILRANARSPDLAEVIHDMAARLERGDTISEAMGAHPQWFKPTGIYLVRAGEVGGVLAETMEGWADLLDRDLELRERFQLYRLLARLAAVQAHGAVAEWEAGIQQALDESRGRVAASLFCYGFALMLRAGVPIVRALMEAAAALEEDSAAEVRQVAADLAADGSLVVHHRLAHVPGLPRPVAELFGFGEETGAADLAAMMERAAGFLRLDAEREVRCAVEQCLRGSDPQDPGAVGHIA